MWQTFGKLLWKRKIAVVAAIFVVLIFLIAIIAPFIAPYDPQRVEPMNRLHPPSAIHWFGTDHFGRDIFSRVLFGARLSLLIGLSVAALSAVLGVFVGSVSAYFMRIGFVLMRVVDALMAFPEIILALAFMAITGHASLGNVIVALGIVYTPRMARTSYGLSLRIKEFMYIEAARALGSSHTRVLIYHLIPNLIAPVVVQATFTTALAILGAAALDFLGVGVPPYVPSWGAMVNEGRLYIIRAPWIIVFPGIFIVLLVLALNILGDTLRDTLDPRLRKLL